MSLEPISARLTAERIASCRAAGYWSDEVLPDILEAQASHRGQTIAVVDGERRVTWSELHRLSRRMALHFQGLGLRRGDVVAIQLPNWLEFIVAYHAIGMFGGVVCQAAVDWRSREMEYALAVGPARAVTIPARYRDFDYAAMMAELRPRLPKLEYVLVARGVAPKGCVSLDALLDDPVEARSPEALLQPYSLGADDVARLLFTSGTTGTPKAIMHTNNTTLQSVRAFAEVQGMRSDDVLLMFLPLSFNWGTTTGIYLPAVLGASVVLLDKFSAGAALALIEAEHVTFLPGSPTAFIALMNSPDFHRWDYSSVRLTNSGGASCLLEVIQRIRKEFGAPFIELYGMNETGNTSWTMPGDDPAEVAGTVGRPIEGTEMGMFDDQGRAVAQGESGEVVLQGPGVCVGYHENPEANASAWDEAGWFHTGDLGRFDERGRLSIVGRKKDLIIRGGVNVSPREVEEAILTYPKVLNAAVLGLPDPYYGEVVCACVIPRPGQRVQLDELVEFLRPRIAHYKLPVRLVMCEEFPMTSSGKVQKHLLQEYILEAGTGVEIEVPSRRV